jgi:hypothetical protein
MPECWNPFRQGPGTVQRARPGRRAAAGVIKAKRPEFEQVRLAKDFIRFVGDGRELGPDQ